MCSCVGPPRTVLPPSRVAPYTLHPMKHSMHFMKAVKRSLATCWPCTHLQHPTSGSHIWYWTITCPGAGGTSGALMGMPVAAERQAHSRPCRNDIRSARHRTGNGLGRNEHHLSILTWRGSDRGSMGGRRHTPGDHCSGFRAANLKFRYPDRTNIYHAHSLR